MNDILLTGGTGFIGSHAAIELIKSGFKIIIADNSKESVIDKIKQITGVKPIFYQINVSNKNALDDIFSKHNIETVIHFAGFKSVDESIQKPLKYYRNNIDTTLTLLEVMKIHQCKKIIFSSSATIYGLIKEVPFTEKSESLGCTNPYGWTKYIIEQILKDVAISDPEMSIVILRYFNPIGGLIKEKSNNLMPHIIQVAQGISPKLTIYGNDYPTYDGTCIRDYIHIVDLIKGHIAALKYSQTHKGYEIFNLGTGQGYSVLDLVKTFEKVNNIKIPYEIVERRAGDVAICYADTHKAETILGWRAEKNIEDMCRDSWK